MNTPTGVEAAEAIAYKLVDDEVGQPERTTVDPPEIGAPLPVVTPLLVPM
jgi:hypothetical protein